MDNVTVFVADVFVCHWAPDSSSPFLLDDGYDDLV